MATAEQVLQRLATAEQGLMDQQGLIATLRAQSDQMSAAHQAAQQTFQGLQQQMQQQIIQLQQDLLRQTAQGGRGKSLPEEGAADEKPRGGHRLACKRSALIPPPRELWSPGVVRR